MKERGSEDMDKETSILSSLHHENIVRFIGIKKHEDSLYIVMEFMNSGSLLDYIRKNDANLKESKLFNMAHQIASGMAYLAEKKIIHK